MSGSSWPWLCCAETASRRRRAASFRKRVRIAGSMSKSAARSLHGSADHARRRQRAGDADPCAPAADRGRRSRTPPRQKCRRARCGRSAAHVPTPSPASRTCTSGSARPARCRAHRRAERCSRPRPWPRRSSRPRTTLRPRARSDRKPARHLGIGRLEEPRGDERFVVRISHRRRNATDAPRLSMAADASEAALLTINFTCNIFLAYETRKGIWRVERIRRDLLQQLAALASPHRMRIVAELKSGRNYVSELARVVGLSRPLLQMHLTKLEAAGLVTSRLELSSDGKAMKFYDARALRADPDAGGRLPRPPPRFGADAATKRKRSERMTIEYAGMLMGAFVLTLITIVDRGRAVARHGGRAHTDVERQGRGLQEARRSGRRGRGDAGGRAESDARGARGDPHPSRPRSRSSSAMSDDRSRSASAPLRAENRAERISSMMHRATFVRSRRSDMQRWKSVTNCRAGRLTRLRQRSLSGKVCDNRSSRKAEHRGHLGCVAISPFATAKSLT